MREQMKRWVKDILWIIIGIMLAILFVGACFYFGIN